MGRSDTSLKSNEPVAIPHDGPIYDFLKKSDQSPADGDDPSMLKAIQLCAETDNINAAANLYQDLKQAGTSKQQIQKLQVYKNSKRNLRSATTEETASRPLGYETTGLNRLLLEWSLSIHTPVPVRKAVQSVICSEEANIAHLSKIVLESLWKSKSWLNSLVSLETAANSPLLKPLLQGALLHDCLSFLFHEYASSFIDSSSDTSSSMAEIGIRMAEILKLLLDNHSGEIPFRSELQQFMLMLFVCPTLPTDGFNTLGIVYGRLLLSSGSIAETAIQEVDSIDHELSHLSALARLQIVKGIAATLASDTLMDNATTSNKQSPFESCWCYLLHVSKLATDPMVRWGALKGLSTLASRLKSQKDSSTTYNHLIRETLDVVMQAWENPPIRKLGSAIPGLFESLVQLIQDEKDLQKLISSILQQPVNRKGRYLALDILLPYMSAGQTLPAESLLEGIGDRGANTGPIADLWKKLLLHLWGQISETSSGIENTLKTWKAQWIPSLSRALVLQTLSRRRQVAAFCLPRVADMMKESKALQPHLSSVLVDLFVAIGRLNHTGKRIVIDFSETVQDRLLWAHLELARHSALHKAMTKEVQTAIAAHIPKLTIQVALTHGITCIRLLAFQTIHVAVSAYGETLEAEADLWRYAFSFVARSTDSKEYTSVMLQSLTSFLDRLSLSEAKREGGCNRFHSFCVDVLLNDIIVKRGAYPGTIADKEGFSLSLLGYILSFVTQDQSFSIDSAFAKHGIIFKRRRSAAEENTMLQILKALFQCEIFGSLFSLLFSIWDNTRALASRFLAKLVVAGQLHNISLPREFSSSEARGSLKARGIYLASSPRQREADTGARILAFLYYSLDDANGRIEYLRGLMDLLKSRLYSMRDQLRAILKGEEDGITLKMAGDLPLAHGIIQAIALSVEHKKLDKLHATRHYGTKHGNLYDELLEILVEAIQVSLAVVADVRKGETVEGMSGEINFGSSSDGRSSVPLNVNTGAIGANGNFSSVSSTDEDAIMGRLAVQRVVIGSWLLTKETCAAIAALFTMEGYRAPYDAFVKAGALLISTLTTLKHAGAAFAARDSLQEVVAVCLAAKNAEHLQRLPDAWANRLVDEISISDKVRDSTLRRSTGYALGFLAIMRSEFASKRGPTGICFRILDQLLTFSLPPEDQVRSALEQLDLGDTQNSTDPFFRLSSGQKRTLVRDEQYEARCRVHALNVIRLIILDAPLASVVRPIVGDAIISAILGYDDISWAVRNSATMVFSAAMLRVIDADKNASNSDRTSSNAITITELFRRYPSLSTFLPSVMRSCLKDSSGVGAANSQIFPILLLLSRIQPIAKSGEMAASLAESFIPIILDCLNSRHHAIRAAGARALANLCPEETKLSHQCSTLLRENLVLSMTDWNMVDGILLSFEALAIAFPLFSQESRDIQSNLLRIVAPDTSLLPPPSCMTTAIKTLATIVSNKKSSENASALSSSVVGECKRIFSHGGFAGLVGGSELYATVTTVFVRFFQPNIWTPKDQTGFQNAVREMMGLFTSSIFDVRLAAAKAFKKGIYHNIDELVACDERRQGSDSPSPRWILSSVAKTLLLSLHVELSRKEALGSHAPTVRRLSRCFLECYYGYTALGNDESMSSFLSALEIDLLWSSAHLIVQNDSVLGDVLEDCNGETFSSSNAVEMMAIVIADKSPSMDIADFCDSLRTFAHVIKRLNDPQASWRSRHSAALAVEKSAIFRLPASDLETFIELRDELVREVLGMLQDSDPDVRATAARAACQLESSSTLSASQLPEQILQDLYLKVYDVSGINDKRSAIRQLEKSLSDNCDGLLEVMISFEEESRKSSGPLLSDPGLLNVASSRKIFEQEEPNPYNERLLANQLTIRSLLEVQGYNKTDSDTREELFRTCSMCLDVLSRNTNVGGMAHEMTRFPFIFPSLHGAILSVAVAIYLGANDDHRSHKADAQTIVDKVKDQSEQSIHPEILFSIETLAQAEPGSPQTKEAIQKSCFLL